jgi:hypothetical protein
MALQASLLKNQSNMINNFKFDTIVSMVVDDAKEFEEYEEKVFSTY